MTTSSESKYEVQGVSKWAYMWESRMKLLTALLFIFGVVSLSTPLLAIMALTVSVVACLAMGITVKTLLGRYFIIAPFLLLMTLPLIFSNGWPINYGNISFALLIILKAVTSMTVMTIILDTQSTDQFINSLAQLKVPSIMITILLLAYRYVFLFLDDIQKMQLALKSRYFKGGIQISNLKTYGQITGGLLIKSINRSEKVYHAMASRCFTGSLCFEESRKIQRMDYFKTSTALCLIGVLVVVDFIV
ncbi:cobalt ECF transporter T component CbiQ [Bacillus alkalicellulosilyticus]|uniref:cobalt ECF transporter T component CbiQ n=1 Tax=Alkalihalobacterium alkalicellulosilyticum TaxID=1912214 RepID=UPI000996543F|nr:cobalt ECF transporter T component CbiQ [Bacillus alkalicellulosilyticus]